MSYKANDQLANPILDEVGEQLAGGFLHIFAGPVPATPDTALDMDNDHTLLVTISVDDDGVTGLSFGAASGSALPKTAAEAWEGTAAFDGAEDAETELDATFFRFCTAGDNGQGAGAAPRLQGTIGATGSGADMERADPAIDSSEIVVIEAFFVRIGSLG